MYRSNGHRNKCETLQCNGENGGEKMAGWRKLKKMWQNWQLSEAGGGYLLAGATLAAGIATWRLAALSNWRWRLAWLAYLPATGKWLALVAWYPWRVFLHSYSATIDIY